MPTGVQEEVVKEKGSQNGHRIIGTWYRQEANEKKRNVQENREELKRPTISLGAWRNDWEFSSQCPPSLHVRLDVQEEGTCATVKQSPLNRRGPLRATVGDETPTWLMLLLMMRRVVVRILV